MYSSHLIDAQFILNQPELKTLKSRGGGQIISTNKRKEGKRTKKLSNVSAILDVVCKPVLTGRGVLSPTPTLNAYTCMTLSLRGSFGSVVDKRTRGELFKDRGRIVQGASFPDTLAMP